MPDISNSRPSVHIQPTIGLDLAHGATLEMARGQPLPSGPWSTTAWLGALPRCVHRNWWVGGGTIKPHPPALAAHMGSSHPPLHLRWPSEREGQGIPSPKKQLGLLYLLYPAWTQPRSCPLPESGCHLRLTIWSRLPPPTPTRHHSMCTAPVQLEALQPGHTWHLSHLILPHGGSTSSRSPIKQEPHHPSALLQPGNPSLAKESEHKSSSLKGVIMARCPLKEAGLG